MQITINQNEIETAIRRYVMGKTEISADSTIAIKLRATRGAEGYQANISIVEGGSAQAASTLDANVGNVGSDVSDNAESAAAETAESPATTTSGKKASSLFSGVKTPVNAPEPVAEPA